MVVSALIALSLGLLGGLMARPLVRPSKPALPSTPLVVEPHTASATITTLPPPNPAPTKPESFQWSQLYAPDYHVYVKNLRAIGCPEPTLRAIVVADVHAVLQPVSAKLEKQLSDLAHSSWVDQVRFRTNAENWRAELLRLPDEEAAMLADYLGEKPPPGAKPPGASDDLAAENQAQSEATAQAPAIEIPLLAQPVNLAALNLDSGQLQAIADLQKSFLQKIGGPNQNPRDPAYQARWRAAQAEVDNLMEGMIGNEAWQNYQLQAYANNQGQWSPNPRSANATGAPATAGE